MESLPKPLQLLLARIQVMAKGTKIALAVGVAAVVLALFAVSATQVSAQDWQYAFTNLSSEDSQAAGALLKQANIPYRLEAGGQAIAVPAAKVYDARLMLAAQGLPRGGGVGFELFDRSDMGVSEFTQKVNLRRALEGELARTVSSLAEVKSARVHLSLGERGLYKDEDKKASATVVVNLQAGRALAQKELLGIRHLVSSAVPGLALEHVTIVDGRGAVLSGEADAAEKGITFQRELERDLERRVVELLEPVVGEGGVIARITATVDSTQVRTDAEAYDPDSIALRSERKLGTSSLQDSAGLAGIAGAAANTPGAPAPQAQGSGSRSNATSADEVKNYEVSKTTTVTTQLVPRLARLSVAVVIDSPDAKPRTAEELARLTELARRAVGFDEARGDLLQLSAAPLTKSSLFEAPAPVSTEARLPAWTWVAVAGVAAALAMLAVVLVLRRRRAPAGALVLKPGARVAELEAQMERNNELISAQNQGLQGLAQLNGALANQSGLPSGPIVINGLPALGAAGGAAGANAAPGSQASPAPKDPQELMREHAQKLALEHPDRAAHLIRAWLSADLDAQKEAARNG